MKYKHLFFDLDHTLWDFDTNSAETLKELFVEFQLFKYCSHIDENEFSRYFQEHNYRLWDQYNKGLISREDIRKDRFRNIFLALQIEALHLADQIGKEYLRICPSKSTLFPHALEVLSYLKEKYRLHVITNGFDDVQFIKLKSSGLEGFFDEVITSERAGYKKPELQIFEYALNAARAECRESIMIGDNLDTDISGARNASMDQVFFNPFKQPHEEAVTYEISCLSNLKEIL